MIFERKVSKQQSDDDKSFAVIKEGFDLKKKRKWRVLMPRVCSNNSISKQVKD